MVLRATDALSKRLVIALSRRFSRHPVETVSPCRKMARQSGSGDFGSGQMPLDLRIATFLAGIHGEPVGTTRSNTEPGSSGSEQHEQRTPVAAISAEQPTASMAIETSERTAGRQRRSQTTGRRRRYRDDRQRLSNSLAQKRYRERKKQAFDNMKALVDSLTAEVDRLQHVKRENEKLTLEMEEYRQLAELHGMNRSSRVAENNTNSTFNDSSPTSVSSLALQCPSSAQLSPIDPTGQPLLALPNMSGADWMGTLNRICQWRTSADVDPSLCLQARIDQLEKDWSDRMTTAENFMRLYQLYGGTTGSSNEHMLPFLSSCMANMHSMNADMTSLKVQLVAQQTQENRTRVQQVFGFPSPDSK